MCVIRVVCIDFILGINHRFICESLSEHVLPMEELCLRCFLLNCCCACAGPHVPVASDFWKEKALPHATSGSSGNLAGSSNPLPTSNNPGGPAQPAGSSGGAMNNGFGTLHPSGSGVNSDLGKQNSGCVSSGNNEGLGEQAGQNVSVRLEQACRWEMHALLPNSNQRRTNALPQAMT